MAIAADTPLIGPPPANILDRVPHQDLLRAMLDESEPLLSDLGSDTSNVLLTLARMWSTFATGAILSKGEAADWTLKRLPDQYQMVLLRARDAYYAPHTERWDDLSIAIVPCAEYMAEAIRRLASSSSAPR
jgi:streptomycin 3"-adenylyltransferase